MPTAQTLDALARANATRFARVELRGRVWAGNIDPADVLRDACVRNMRVVEVIRWWPYGRDRRRTPLPEARRIARRAGVSEHRTCGQLTDRQIRVLVEALR